MLKLILSALLFVSLCLSPLAEARKSPVRHKVKSYTKKDGTRVRSHQRGSGSKSSSRKPSKYPPRMEGQVDRFDPPSPKIHPEPNNPSWAVVGDNTVLNPSPVDLAGKELPEAQMSRDGQQWLSEHPTWKTEPLMALNPLPEKITGLCIEIADDNVMTVATDEGVTTVLLYGTAAPCEGQSFNMTARQFTSSLALGKQVTIYPKGAVGKLLLGWVFVGSQCINKSLIECGYAWYYPRMAPNEKKLALLQSEAKAAKRGLWIQNTPIEPWTLHKFRTKIEVQESVE